jgi:hypothetical protein
MGRKESRAFQAKKTTCDVSKSCPVLRAQKGFDGKSNRRKKNVSG